jgi:two-component system, OmpR family, alkaline phosphatase synthesis response regulator PhoP
MSKTVVLVDDEDNVREVAQMSLELMAGWTVVAAHDGEEGIRRAIELRPDLILLDVMMPGLDGPSTFKRLQEDERTRDIPVIMLTAKAQTSERERLSDLGVAAVLTKPFDPVQLPEDIRSILGWTA